MSRDPLRGAAPLPKATTVARIGCVAALALGLANCASQPQRSASRGSSSEIGAFPQKKYGAASPRVVGENEEVPKGGGRYLVGKTYTIAGRSYTPRENPGYSAVGTASWYGEAFHGRRTANGEVYDMRSITAAHPTMPLPSYARVTNLTNGHSMVVRVNDRGPYHGGRIMDVSERVATYLNFKANGTGRVKVDYLGKASTAGSDDRKLLASLRTDGSLSPSPFSGNETIQVASAEPIATPRPPLTASPALPRPAPAAAPVIALAERVETPATQAAVAAPALERAVAAPVVLARNIPLPPERTLDVGASIGTPARGRITPLPSSVATAPRVLASSTVAYSPVASAVPAPAQVQVAASAPIPVNAPAPINAPAPLRPQAASLSYAPSGAAPLVAPSSASARQLSALYYAGDAASAATFTPSGDPLGRISTSGQVPLRQAISRPADELSVAVGVFRDRANAERIAGLLGRKAHILPLTLSGNEAYKVSAGPFVNPAEAKQAQERAIEAGAVDARLVMR